MVWVNNTWAQFYIENRLTPEGSNEHYTLYERMDYYGVPGVSIAVIKNAEIVWAKGYGIVQSGKNKNIDSETVFSVGSVSKIGTATAILRLVEQGKLNLDIDVNEYLSKWKIPENKYTRNNPVTLRRILSHTAGLTVHGFADFLPFEELPTTIEILNGTYPAKNDGIYVNIPVGSEFRYSGGGTQVLQLVIEEVIGNSFPEAMDELLFDPLEMDRSTYLNPIPEEYGNIAKAHNRSGNPVALPRGYQSMPEMAASGWWTTPTDLSKLIITLLEAYDGCEDFINQSIVIDMMTKVAPGDYGLGPRIGNAENGAFFSHGGANDSYRASIRGYLDTKNGYAILTNGTRGSELIQEIRAAIIKFEEF